MPVAVSDRPPGTGPMPRYLIPLNSGSPSFLSSLSSRAGGGTSGEAAIAAGSGLLDLDLCSGKAATLSSASRAQVVAPRPIDLIMKASGSGGSYCVPYGKAPEANEQCPPGCVGASFGRIPCMEPV